MFELLPFSKFFMCCKGKSLTATKKVFPRLYLPENVGLKTLKKKTNQKHNLCVGTIPEAI